MILIIVFKFNFEKVGKMKIVTDSLQQIKVCTGPGCKAWNSKGVLSIFWKTTRKSLGKKYKVCPVSCMKRCGGGVAVEVPSDKKLFKFREPGEALSTFEESYTSPGPMEVLNPCPSG
jgi:NADH:ubiquinone oxidoreductase subunit E